MASGRRLPEAQLCSPEKNQAPFNSVAARSPDHHDSSVRLPLAAVLSLNAGKDHSFQWIMGLDSALFIRKAVVTLL